MKAHTIHWFTEWFSPMWYGLLSYSVYCLPMESCSIWIRQAHIFLFSIIWFRLSSLHMYSCSSISFQKQCKPKGIHIPLQCDNRFKHSEHDTGSHLYFQFKSGHQGSGLCDCPVHIDRFHYSDVLLSFRKDKGSIVLEILQVQRIHTCRDL